MKDAVVYIHGKGGCPDEASRFVPLFPGAEVIGFGYRSETPWEAREEFPAFFREVRRSHGRVLLIANSIGAYLAMCALSGEEIGRAFLISPVVDMERLILGMMSQEGVSEEELRSRGEIVTESGAVLSWRYLCFARENPVGWSVPTAVLYGGCDRLTSREQISAFAERVGASLTVMEDGGHWFHTDEELRFLDEWLRREV
ncbi:MAG: alpha/beta hydrolase [Ruminococcus sp.]|nr:alpha/beta hydrolase [Ruminococcus sp.]